MNQRIEILVKHRTSGHSTLSRRWDCCGHDQYCNNIFSYKESAMLYVIILESNSDTVIFTSEVRNPNNFENRNIGTA